METMVSNRPVCRHGYRSSGLKNGSSLCPIQAKRLPFLALLFSLLISVSHASLLASIPSSTSSSDCYWPDGTRNTEYFPCSSSTQGPGADLCCRIGDICLENGVCQAIEKTGSDNNITLYHRAACTSNEWSDNDKCPTDCIGNGLQPHQDAAMTPCPDSDYEWICHDAHLSKANCSTGDYIITLDVKPLAVTTLTSSSSSGSTSKTKTTSPVTAITVSANSTSLVQPTSTGAAGGISASATSTPQPPAGLPAPSESPVPSDTEHRTAVVPLAVGISVGGAAVIFAGILGFLFWRKRQRDMPARAETPPPRNTLDDLDPALPGLVFRADSLRNRQSNANMNGSNMNGGGAGPGASPGSGGSLNGIIPMASTMGPGISNTSHHYSNRANSMRNNSMRNNSLHNSRFAPDAVAMHDVPRSPSSGWLQMQGGPPNGPNKPPEIPYDGRRFAPYYGVPPGETNGYSELPG